MLSLDLVGPPPTLLYMISCAAFWAALTILSRVTLEARRAEQDDDEEEGNDGRRGCTVLYNVEL